MFHDTARRRILVALFAGARTGLALVSARAARRGSVYVHLDRMEDDGLVISALMPSGRREYALTPSGLGRACSLLNIAPAPDSA